MIFRRRELENVPDLSSVLPSGEGYLWSHGGEGFAAWGEAARFDPGTGADRFERALRALTDFFAEVRLEGDSDEDGVGPVAFGSFTFEDDEPGSVLVVPEISVVRRAGRAWVISADGVEEPEPHPRLPVPTDKIRYAGSTMSETAWLEAVAKAVEVISSGELDKVVLARDLLVWSRSPIDLRSVLSGLAEHFPECYTFGVDGLVGSSPELLVRRSGSAIASLVLAGSAPRGMDGDHDAKLAAALLSSSKDRWEHELSARSVLAELEPMCGELSATDPYVLALENVQHLATRVTGELTAPRSSLELAGRLHPTAAVCGSPRAGARSAIRALEHLDRNRYSGPVGWVDANGDGEWAIALRCAEIDGSRGRLFAGAGIVSGSIPEAELEETRLKLRAMQGALEGG